ncbi:hypothetical protein BOTBODRAFT_36641 [Botryobasidium botryosum FD-172 SS1]|uniref:Uncharacterized protein n=1 Tax=Botryobasidium botryosum (strain FD-172 SS1) TaxID=930990 RepID=A0A067M382_BOTB1|nr:hypothetical protein BOTBODRAFT_36641 [Botryobasidium botryosum FD-172 SS1]
MAIMTNHIIAFLSPLLAHIARWRTLHIRCGELGNIPQLLSTPVPLLEELNLRLDLDPWSPTLLPLPHLFADCTPRLRVLHIDSLPVYPTASMYTGLISLHLNRFDSADGVGTTDHFH